jgi:hypothetical protein
MLALLRWKFGLALLLLAVCPLGSAGELYVGFGSANWSPVIPGTQAFLAGQERNRLATGIHDNITVSCVVLRDGNEKIALFSVDAIGLPYSFVEKIRNRLQADKFKHVLIASTHTHEGPDTIGLWGPDEKTSGVNPTLLTLLEQRLIRAVSRARDSMTPVIAKYGTAEDVKLLKDFRQPEIFDPTLRVLTFVRKNDQKPVGIIVQWNSHPVEPDGNTLVSRDFPGVVVDSLSKQIGCPAVYFSGAIGGLMGTPTEGILDTEDPPETVFEFISAYGEAVAGLAIKAIATCKPIELTPMRVSAVPIAVPLDNAEYRQARALGVLQRAAYAPGDDPESFGEEKPAEETEGDQVLKTEVTYLRLGDLDLVGIPGELYPELVYGEFPKKVEANVDFPKAAAEKPVTKIIPGKDFLLLGLANDEVGYIIPKRQWDTKPPYAYGLKKPQYGEQNSLGPETARVLLEALERRVADVEAASKESEKPAKGKGK